MVPAIARQHGDQGIVVSGDQRNPFGRSQPAQPGSGFGELGRQSQVHQITGDCDVIGTDLVQVAHEGIEDDLDVASPAPQLPGQVAEQALVRQLWPGHGRQPGKVEIGDVGEPEHEERSVDALPLVENRRFILGRDHGGKRYRRRGFELRTAAKSRVASALAVILHPATGGRTGSAGDSTYT